MSSFFADPVINKVKNFDMKTSLIGVNFSSPSLRKSRLLRFMLLIVSLYLILIDTCDACTVTSPSGQFRGVINKSILTPDHKFCSYLGIPYAQPPLGALRFRNPIPVEPFVGVYDAISDGNICPQTDPIDPSLTGDEDCLYLNVYTPKVPEQRPRSLLPVIVYIHGGGFYFGSGSRREFSPDYIMPHNVIFVTFNYRLNVFGFLNLGIPECAGNMGLRDQVVALEWVKRNIQSFGGDPNCVTLMGESAGALSAYLLALSPLARGLFHRLIIMSAILPNWVSRDVEPSSIRFAKFLGFSGNTGNRQEILRYLQQLEAKQLTYGDTSFEPELNKTDIRQWARHPPFFPSADAFLGPAALLPKSLEELGKEIYDIPILMGQTNADGDNFFIQKNAEEFLAYIQKNLIFFLDPVYIGNERIETEVVAKVRDYYFGRCDGDNELNRATKFLQDLFYFNFYQQTAVFDASYRNNKIYHYLFSYDGSFQFYKRLYMGEEYYRNISGASHTEDLNYLFYSSRNFPTLNLTYDDCEIIHQMSTWWTNFAKTGNPNINYAYDYIGGGWEPVTPRQNSYLLIDKKSCSIRRRINEERRRFWDSLPRAVPFSFDYPIESFSYFNQYN